MTADNAARKGMEHGLQKVEVFVKGPGSGRETAIRPLQAAGLEILGVRDVSPQAHNGVFSGGEAPSSGPRPGTEAAPPLPAGGPQALLKGERRLTEKCAVERRSYPPGEHGRGRIKQSEYLLQLREKQKARRYYGLLERQFRTTYEKASRGQAPGENLLRMLETRLDNVVYRLGFGRLRAQARQLVRHGHFQVNGRRVNIPSYAYAPATWSR